MRERDGNIQRWFNHYLNEKREREQSGSNSHTRSENNFNWKQGNFIQNPDYQRDSIFLIKYIHSRSTPKSILVHGILKYRKQILSANAYIHSRRENINSHNPSKQNQIEYKSCTCKYKYIQHDRSIDYWNKITTSLDWLEPNFASSYSNFIINTSF